MATFNKDGEYQLGIRVERETAEAAKTIASARGTSLSQVLRSFLLAYVQSGGQLQADLTAQETLARLDARLEEIERRLPPPAPSPKKSKAA